MTAYELLGNLREFYLECSHRGWCKVITYDNKDFISLYSSETNFTHLPQNFGKYPEKCWVSPKLAGINIKKIEKVLSGFDSSRLVSLEPRRTHFRIVISDANGKTLLIEKIRYYSLKFNLPFIVKLDEE